MRSWNVPTMGTHAKNINSQFPYKIIPMVSGEMQDNVIAQFEVWILIQVVEILPGLV